MPHTAPRQQRPKAHPALSRLPASCLLLAASLACCACLAAAADGSSCVRKQSVRCADYSEGDCYGLMPVCDVQYGSSWDLGGAQCVEGEAGTCQLYSSIRSACEGFAACEWVQGGGGSADQLPSSTPSPSLSPTPSPLPSPLPTPTPSPSPSSPLPGPQPEESQPAMESSPSPQLAPSPGPTPLPSPSPYPETAAAPTPAPTPAPSHVPPSLAPAPSYGGYYRGGYYAYGGGGSPAPPYGSLPTTLNGYEDAVLRRYSCLEVRDAAEYLFIYLNSLVQQLDSMISERVLTKELAMFRCSEFAGYWPYVMQMWRSAELGGCMPPAASAPSDSAAGGSSDGAPAPYEEDDGEVPLLDVFALHAIYIAAAANTICTPPYGETQDGHLFKWLLDDTIAKLDPRYSEEIWIQYGTQGDDSRRRARSVVVVPSAFAAQGAAADAAVDDAGERGGRWLRQHPRAERTRQRLLHARGRVVGAEQWRRALQQANGGGGSVTISAGGKPTGSGSEGGTTACVYVRFASDLAALEPTLDDLSDWEAVPQYYAMGYCSTLLWKASLASYLAFDRALGWPASERPPPLERALREPCWPEQVAPPLHAWSGAWRAFARGATYGREVGLVSTSGCPVLERVWMAGLDIKYGKAPEPSDASPAPGAGGGPAQRPSPSSGPSQSPKPREGGSEDPTGGGAGGGPSLAPLDPSYQEAFLESLTCGQLGASASFLFQYSVVLSGYLLGLVDKESYEGGGGLDCMEINGHWAYIAQLWRAGELHGCLPPSAPAAPSDTPADRLLNDLESAIDTLASLGHVICRAPYLDRTMDGEGRLPAWLLDATVAKLDPQTSDKLREDYLLGAKRSRSRRQLQRHRRLLMHASASQRRSVIGARGVITLDEAGSVVHAELPGLTVEGGRSSGRQGRLLHNVLLGGDAAVADPGRATSLMRALARVRASAEARSAAPYSTSSRAAGGGGGKASAATRSGASSGSSSFASSSCGEPASFTSLEPDQSQLEGYEQDEYEWMLCGELLWRSSVVSDMAFFVAPGKEPPSLEEALQQDVCWASSVGEPLYRWLRVWRGFAGRARYGKEKGLEDVIGAGCPVLERVWMAGLDALFGDGSSSNGSITHDGSEPPAAP